MRILLFGSPTEDGISTLGLSGSFCGGGWVDSLLTELRKSKDLEIGFAFFYDVENVVCKTNGRITYFALSDYPFESSKVPAKTQKAISNVVKDFNPDIVHVIGPERPHGYFIMKLVGPERFVFSITGLVSIIAPLYYAGVDKREFKRTFGDILRGRGVIAQKKSYTKKAEVESKLLSEAKHVIGRTEWDRSCSLIANPSIRYHFVNEALRPAFYDHKDTWNINECIPHRIFVSQASYPLKGLHMLMGAVAMIHDKYPDIQIVVSGPDMSRRPGLFGFLRYPTYGWFISRLAKKMNLSGALRFIGNIDQNKMVDEYIKSNVVVVPSIIENKSNSLGEAMMLGVPCVSSYVGGMTEIIDHGVNGFVYPFNEPTRLAFYLDMLFSDKETAVGLAKKGPETAIKLFDREKMLEHVIETYKEIADGIK